MVQDKAAIFFLDAENKLFESEQEMHEYDKTENRSRNTAINEETGEINWDCPCLKSALEPPCGEFFKEAFSCFINSKADPRGSDCLVKFAAMQECFKAHPEVYLNDDQGEEANRT